MKASIVLGLGWGDEGKGKTTDYLCSRPNSIAVRFSGGQQAGHTVILDGRKHIHSSFGAGTLRGVPSYFSEHTTIYPNSIAAERNVLAGKGVHPQLFVHPFANLTTPYDIAWNRITESFNGHGSCGLGVAATMKRNIESPYKLYAVDYLHPKILEQKLEGVRKYYTNKITFGGIGDFMKIVDSQMELFLAMPTKGLFSVKSYDYLKRFENIVFEGSQGILLDMDHGFFPNVTFANTTSKNALEICEKIKPTNYLGLESFVRLYYITRCYQTRHGAGWMSNEAPIELVNNQEEINVHNEWQKDFRIGELDYDLLSYALQVDQAYSGDLRKTLVVTCQDQRPDFKFDETKLQLPGSYFAEHWNSSSPEDRFAMNVNPVTRMHG